MNLNGPETEEEDEEDPIEKFMYNQALKRAACDYAKETSTLCAAEKYRVSVCSIRHWMAFFGMPKQRLGAPKGNTNARGGRLNPVDAGVKLVHRANSRTI